MFGEHGSRELFRAGGVQLTDAVHCVRGEFLGWVPAFGEFGLEGVFLDLPVLALWWFAIGRSVGVGFGFRRERCVGGDGG